MCVPRIQERVPNAIPLKTGCVRNRRLVFHKKSVDGSAKADALYSANQEELIWGVVYQITAHEKSVLDQHEFLGTGYNEVLAHVESGTSVIEAWMYVARTSALDGSLKPYCWYREYVRIGAIHHGLPLDYIRAIEQVETQIDPDEQRRMRNYRLMQPTG